MSMQRKMAIWLSGALILFVVVINVSMSYLLREIAEKESIQELRSGLVAYQRFDEQRRALVMVKAKSIAQIPHLKATLTIPDLDRETLLVTALGVAGLVEVELMILADAAGSTLLVLGPDADRRTDPAGVSLSGLARHEIADAGQIELEGQIYRLTAAPVVVGDVVVGFVGIGQSINSEAALALASEVSGTGVAIISDNAVHSSTVALQFGSSSDTNESLLKGAQSLPPGEVAIVSGPAHSGRLTISSMELVGGKARALLYRAIDPVQSSASFATSLMIVGSVLALLLGIWASYVVAARISRPILRLTDAARRYGSGDFSGRIEAGDDNEIGKLAVAFNQMASDIAESRQELISSRDAAEAASRAKSEFLARMSHEIRTPMNGIVGMAEMLDISGLDSSQSRCNDIIQQSSQTLLTIVNDMLDFSRIESGKIELEMADFNLRTVVGNSIELLKDPAAAKGLWLEQDFTELQNESVCGDANRIQQIVVNLIANAIKFTSRGGVKITVSEQREDEEYSQYRVSVADTGIGISQEDHERVFDLFYQIDGSSTREYGGTGLGLAICKDLVVLMDGDITLNSKIGEGSDFCFSVRLMRAPDVTRSIAALRPEYGEIDSDDLGYRVLLVEDNAVNRDVATRMLNQLGCSVAIAEDGIEAIEHYEKERWDLIFMDCQMPRMDGYEATRQIRERERVRELQAVPIVALTANALKGDAERCLSAGMTDYVSKPYTLAQLRDAINRNTGTKVVVAAEEDWTCDFYEETDPPTLCPDPINEMRQFQVAGEADIVAEVIGTFIDSGSTSIREIETGADNEDTDAVCAAAHRLKGACASVGGQKLAGMCAELEQATRESGSQAVVGTTALAAEFAQLVEELRENIACNSESVKVPI